MADQEKEKNLDHLLDWLLAQYSGAEPRPGLETRVLAQIAQARTASTERSFGLRWVWAGAASVAVLTVIVLLTFFSQPNQRNQPTDRIAQIRRHTAAEETGQAAASHGAEPVVAAHRRKIRKEGQVARFEIKQNVFPTPVPLSEQERLMFTYIANTPHEEVVAQIERNDQQESDAFWRDSAVGAGHQRPAAVR